jgi:hypothetical protein
MITPSFGLTATERVLPRLALDFTTASLDSRITFTRSGNTATVTNADSSITIVNADLPRFDFANGVCKGLLIEEARTNSLLNSILNNAVAGSPGTAPTSWTNNQVTGSLSAIESASYSSGYKLTFSCTNNRRTIFQFATSPANTSLTFSVTCEVISGTNVVSDLITATLFPAGSAIAGYTVNGVARASNFAVPTGVNVISLTVTIAALAGTTAFSLGVGVLSNATGVVKFSNPQVEAGAFPTSYIPTVATTVTRNADVATMTGTNFSSWFNASEGAFVASFDTYSPTTQKYIGAVSAGGTIANSFLFTILSGSTDNYVLSGGVQQARLLTGTIAANTLAKLGFRYANANFAIAANGGGLQTQLSGSLPVGMDRLNIGSSAGNGVQLNGHMAKLFWYSKLTNAELVAFTK